MSPPPKAPPICEPVLCNNIAPTNTTARISCTYGSMDWIAFIPANIAYLLESASLTGGNALIRY